MSKFTIVIKHTQYLSRVIEADCFANAYALANNICDDFTVVSKEWHESGDFNGPYVSIASVKEQEEK